MQPENILLTVPAAAGDGGGGRERAAGASRRLVAAGAGAKIVDLGNSCIEGRCVCVGEREGDSATCDSGLVTLACPREPP